MGKKNTKMHRGMDTSMSHWGMFAPLEGKEQDSAFRAGVVKRLCIKKTQVVLRWIIVSGAAKHFLDLSMFECVLPEVLPDGKGWEYFDCRGSNN